MLSGTAGCASTPAGAIRVVPPLRRLAHPVVLVAARSSCSSTWPDSRLACRRFGYAISFDPNAKEERHGGTERHATRSSIQYLNEAYGKEKELEVALQAHIAMTTRPPYKKRLKEHLKETKAHGRAGRSKRIKQLGGKAEAVPRPRPGARGRGRLEGGRGGVEGTRRRQGPAPRDPRHRRGREDAEERQDGVLRTSSRRSRPTTRSRRSPRPWATRRPPSSRSRSGARRSAWRSSSRSRSRRWPRRVATEEIPAAERRRAARVEHAPLDRQPAATALRANGSLRARRAQAGPQAGGPARGSRSTPLVSARCIPLTAVGSRRRERAPRQRP